MKTKMKKWLIGGLTVGAVVAPITSAVACGSSSTTTQSDKIINDGDKIWATGNDTTTYSEFKKTVDKQQDAQTASSSFISQIKYELTETLYTKEQIASKDYQVAFLKWNVYTQEKNQMATAKKMAALIYDKDTTATSIDNNDSAIQGHFLIKDVLGITGTPSSADIFRHIYDMTEAPSKYVASPTEDILQSRKDDFNKELKTFKENFDKIVTAKKEITELETADASNLDWSKWKDSSKYPKLLKPLSEITKIHEKTIAEARKAVIDKYQTKPEGVEAWASQRSSSYGGASTDAEAIKYLVNQEINTTAFGKFTYSLDSSYTIEQLLAKDNSGNSIFPWFKDLDKKLGDQNSTTINKNDPKYIWTNDLTKFKDANGGINVNINADNIKDQDPLVTPLLSNKIFFISKKTLVTNDILVKLDEDNNLQKPPILITHSLIGAKQGTTWNLPWTITKDSIKNLLSFSKGSDIQSSKLGIDLFTKLYMDDTTGTTTNKDLTNLFNEYVSDDTGSRTNSGELGVQTYQWYARKGGMNDGFALATMVAYADLQNDKASTSVYNLGDAIVKDSPTAKDGEEVIAKLKSDILSKVPQNILSKFMDDVDGNGFNLEDAVSNKISGDKFKSSLTTATVNIQLTNWIDSLSDDDIKVMFGSIFRDAFEKRPVVYELAPSAQSSSEHRRFLLASPDSGVHIINITDATKAWQEKYEEDMVNVSKENDASKAKVTWSTLYSDFFTDNEKISNLLAIDEFQDQIKQLPTNNKDLVDEWVKAGYVKFEQNDDAAAKGQKIVDAINKSIAAAKIDNNSQSAVDSVKDRISTYLIGQQDNQFMLDTIDPTTLYDELLKSLLS